MASAVKRRRRGYTVRDLAVTLCCLLVAGSLLLSLTGATRNLSRTQVCADHLRQLFSGTTAYINQYNTYPPNAPYPQYMPSETVNGLNTGGWDPNIGFIMTHGLGYEPPARDTISGHFRWYVLPYDDLPEVCKCPAISPTLFTLNPELDQANPLESLVYQYALSYQTSGTCRAATTVLSPRTSMFVGRGGRNPLIPDPTSSLAARPVDNGSRGCPFVWVYKHKQGAAPSDPASDPVETSCYLQAVHPAEVQSPGRVYYLADSRDYRPYVDQSGTPGYPPAGLHSGWISVSGNRTLLGSRHFGYANVVYLDGRVTRDNQMHMRLWNLDYNYASDQARSSQWRASSFATDVRVASIRGQVHIMPVLMVTGWEYFFNANGPKAQ